MVDFNIVEEPLLEDSVSLLEESISNDLAIISLEVNKKHRSCKSIRFFPFVGEKVWSYGDHLPEMINLKLSSVIRLLHRPRKLIKLSNSFSARSHKIDRVIKSTLHFKKLLVV